MKTILILLVLFLPLIGFSQDSHPCGAPTKKGTPCKRIVSGQEHCFQHGGTIKEVSTPQGPQVQCKAISKSSGQQCRNKTTNLNGLCTCHQSSKNIVNN